MGGWLWLSRYEPNEVIRVDPVTGALIDRLGFDSQPNLAGDGKRLWVIADRGGESLVVEIDPSTAAEDRRDPARRPTGFRCHRRRQPVGREPGPTTVTRVDLAEGRVASVSMSVATRAAWSWPRSIWVAVNTTGTEQTGSVVRHRSANGEVTASVATGRWIHSLAASDDAIWATNFLDGTISVIDAPSATSRRRPPIGNRPGWSGSRPRFCLAHTAPPKRLAAHRPDEAARAGGGPRCRAHGRVVRARRSFAAPACGSPTVVLDQATRATERRGQLSSATVTPPRVCAYEPVGIADPAEAELAGPAADRRGRPCRDPRRDRRTRPVRRGRRMGRRPRRADVRCHRAPWSAWCW